MIGYVYYICNIVDERIYVGSTNNMRQRRNKHICLLKKNSHHNLYLQRFYNKHGEDSIYFEIIYVGVEYIAQEQYHIETNKKQLFNISMDATRPGGWTGHKHTNETKRKLSEVRKGKGTKITNEKVIEIKKLLNEGITQKDIAKQFNVVESVVCGINRGKYWSNVDVPAGETRENTKLSPNDVKKIKILLSQGMTCPDIARSFLVGRTTVQKIKSNKIWKHIN